MDELVIKHNDTGNCLVDVDKVAVAWNDKFFISQWNNEYRLIEQVELFKEDSYKVTISAEQAFEIIEKVKLLPIKTMLFRNATTWRTKSNILSEKERVQKILDETKDPHEKQFMADVIYEFSCALKSDK